MTKLVATVRTPFTPLEFARWVLQGWSEVDPDLPSEGAVGVLYAQTFTETGGRNCWNWNFGNIKHVKNRPERA